MIQRPRTVTLADYIEQVKASELFHESAHRLVRQSEKENKHEPAPLPQLSRSQPPLREARQVPALLVPQLPDAPLQVREGEQA